MSVFGTIHPDIFRLRAPLGSGPLANGIRLASLGSEVSADTDDPMTDAPVLAYRDASVEECVAALDERPASFDKRFASVDECRASVDENLGSAMQAFAGNLRVPGEHGVRSAVRMGSLPAGATQRKHVRPGQARRNFGPPTEDDAHTAIYDISAHTVYLPSGRRLEVHSGLGALMDNPRHIRVKMRGPTPVNVYKLTLRERLFHGVRAIRLNPIDEPRMHGRDGILAHTYMLGSNGQSNGCVSFRNYPEFLNAFLKGEVTRIAVVERLDRAPGPEHAAGRLPDEVRELVAATDPTRDVAAVATDNQ
jgi:hypothetical protein